MSEMQSIQTSHSGTLSDDSSLSIQYQQVSPDSNTCVSEETTNSQIIKEPFPSQTLTVDDIVFFSKGNQKYQKRIFMGFCFSHILLGMVAVSLLYFFYPVSFRCQLSSGGGLSFILWVKAGNGEIDIANLRELVEFVDR